MIRGLSLLPLVLALASCQGVSAPSALTVTVVDDAGEPVRLARVDVAGVDADLTGGEGQSRFEPLLPGRYEVRASLLPRCPAEAEVVVPGGGEAFVTLTLADRIDLGPDQGQVGFDRTVEVMAAVRCGEGQVRWEVIEGDPALVDADGNEATVRTLPLSAFVDLDDRPGIVPIGREASQRTRLRASVDGAADEIEITAASRSGGVFQVPTGADVYLNGGEGETFAFELAVRPEGSTASLSAAETRTPWLRPDLFGTYRVTERVSGLDLEIEAGRWVEVPRDCGRAECHPSEASTFPDTAHATTFARGLAGELGPSFGDRCAECHAVGWDPVVDSGGFDDVARGRAFRVVVPTDLEDVPAEVRALGNVWCTACHGPGRIVPPDHRWEWGAKYATAVCAQCHDGAEQAPTRGPQPPEAAGVASRVAEWRLAKMARFVADLGPGDPALERGCARCHSAQGFVAWQRSGSLATLPDRRTVQPITCPACHDPHAGTGPAQLRMAGGPLGSAALCATCHSAQVSADDPEDRAARRAPHAPQAEVALAPGAPHGVADACARCHMAAGDSTMGGHTFALRGPDGAPNPAACTGCHAGATDLDRVLAPGDWDGDGARRAQVEEFDALVALLAADVRAAAAGLANDACGGRLAAGIDESAGRVVLVDGAGLDLGDCDGDGIIAAGEEPAVLPPDRDDLYRASFALLEATLDGSHGLHDPRGQVRALQRAITALGRTPPPWDRP